MIDLSPTETDLLRHQTHFPSGSDLTLQVLKGHLLVEEVLREILLVQLPFPDALKGDKGTSFDCHQVICLVEAMTAHSDKEPWVWKAAKRLNNIRNDLAHQLSPKALDEKVSGLIKFVTKDNPEVRGIADEVGVPDGHEFETVILVMCSCLSTLKAVLMHQRKLA